MDPEVNRAFNLALRYLARRSKTILEMKRYLEGKDVDAQVTQTVLEKLIQSKYLDDRAFAIQFIENRLRYNPKSTYALGYELRQKGIGATLADELLAEYDDTRLALKAVRLKQGQWRHLDMEASQKKLMNHLRYRGFDHGTCREAWQFFQTTREKT
ncbi:MAG: regulatory protein RecX [Desulfobacter sp.]